MSSPIPIEKKILLHFITKTGGKYTEEDWDLLLPFIESL